LEGQVINPFPIEDVTEIEPRRAILGIQVKAIGHKVGCVLNCANLVERMGERIVRCIRKAVGSTLIQRDQQGVIVGITSARTKKDSLSQVVVEGRQTGKQALLVNGAKYAAHVTVNEVTGRRSG